MISHVDAVAATTSATTTATITTTDIPTVNNTTILPFYFPNGNPILRHDEKLLEITASRAHSVYSPSILTHPLYQFSQTTVKQLYGHQPYLTESQFLPVSEACGLPQYLNMAFFRKLESVGELAMRVSFSVFIEGWTDIARNHYDDESLYFNILKKQNSLWLSPEDFLPVLEDVVLNHPGLNFLGENPMFQERYIETVICRLFYEAKCATGRMKMAHFRKCKFTQMIKNLGPDVDLNNTRDCFSYKHFYVLYCKFWVLDEDHDLIISENDLLNYNDGVLSQRVTQQVIQHGRIAAFSRESHHKSAANENTLTYLDYIWFLLSETDKSTPMAIEYWFRCMDEDGNGIITSYDLLQYWEEQDKKLSEIIETYEGEECVLFDDLIRQMNDLIQPAIPGQFKLTDLKRNGIIAERFFDTFLNIEKFQIHDTYQGLIRANQQLEKEKKKQYELEKKRISDVQKRLLLVQQQQDLAPDQAVAIAAAVEAYNLQQQSMDAKNSSSNEPFSLGVWCDYAEQEYELLVLNEHEQCNSLDGSDWNQDECEEEFETEEPLKDRLLQEQEPEQNEREEQENHEYHEEQEDHGEQEGEEEKEEKEKQEEELHATAVSPIASISKQQEESVELVESPTTQSGSGSEDQESDSSAPSTPVMQALVDEDKKWIKQESEESNPPSTNWIWHSV